MQAELRSVPTPRKRCVWCSEVNNQILTNLTTFNLSLIKSRNILCKKPCCKSHTCPCRLGRLDRLGLSKHMTLWILRWGKSFTEIQFLGNLLSLSRSSRRRSSLVFEHKIWKSQVSSSSLFSHLKSQSEKLAPLIYLMQHFDAFCTFWYLRTWPYHLDLGHLGGDDRHNHRRDLTSESSSFCGISLTSLYAFQSSVLWLEKIDHLNWRHSCWGPLCIKRRRSLSSSSRSYRSRLRKRWENIGKLPAVHISPRKQQATVKVNAWLSES